MLQPRLKAVILFVMVVLIPSAGPADSASPGQHWSFQPLKPVEVPSVSHPRWCQSVLDRFVLRKLEGKAMAPSPRADQRTLIRRAYFDLTGLPPTPAAVAAFARDRSPGAFARLIDRLLASPRYGERWGRHWLDVARYADTKGYVFTAQRRFPYAYTYRDYVIRAFNQDRPYNRFILEQIAADQLDLGADKGPLAALGFLTLGRRFLNNPHDIIDDRIDVVTRGLMGLTVSCARCHDHKYDPIPTEDYYSLYGVFASSEEPAKRPLLSTSEFPPFYRQYLQAKKEKQEAFDRERRRSEQAALQALRDQAGQYLLTAQEVAGIDNASRREAIARERKLDPGVVQRWLKALQEWREENHPVFRPWFAAAAASEPLTESEFVIRQQRFLQEDAKKTDRANPVVVGAIHVLGPKSLPDLAKVYGTVFKEVDSQWRERLGRGRDAATPSRLPSDAREEIRALLYGPGAPPALPRARLPRLYEVKVQERLRRLRRELDAVDAEHPGAPPRAMALYDKPRPVEPVVFRRGSPSHPGRHVPRRFLALLSGDNRQPFQHGSGRLELARAIASPRNPLTARVVVNRVWLWHFGAPIVPTPSDLGMRAPRPVQADLLDYLAYQFIEHQWSIKWLHRAIMLSSVYQQSSQGNPAYETADPFNRYLWRFNRQRLSFEAMRDTILDLSGQLDLKMEGQPVEIAKEPTTPRRSVYGLIERQNLPSLFRTFDFASPDTSCPKRIHTTVPQQALYLMNSGFSARQARGLIARSDIQQARGDEDRIRRLYALVFQRKPTGEELGLGLAYLRGGITDQKSLNGRAQPAPAGKTHAESGRAEFTPWIRYAQTLLMSNELMFVD